MATLEKIDFDPFAEEQQAPPTFEEALSAEPDIEPVDFDPFAEDEVIPTIDRADREPIGTTGIQRFSQAVGKDKGITQRLTESVFGEQTGKVFGVAEDIVSAPAMFAAHVLVKPVVDTLENFVFDKALAPAAELVSEQIPDPVKAQAKSIINNIAEYPQYQGVFEAIGEGAEAVKKYAKAHPKDAARVAGILALAEFIPVAKGTQIAAKEPLDILKDASEIITRRQPERIGKSISGAADDALRAVKPGNKNLRTAKIRNINATEFQKELPTGEIKTIKGPEAYKEHMATYMDEVVSNKDLLDLTDFNGAKVTIPTDLKSAFQAEEQLEGIFFKQFDDMVKASGAKGGKADYVNLVNKLRKLKEEKIGVWAPKDLDAIDDRIEYLVDVGRLDLVRAQGRLAEMNSQVSTAASNKIRSMSSGENALNAIEADYLRGEIDDVIKRTGGDGEGWKKARRNYGSLIVVRDDIANKFSSIAKQTKGDLNTMFDAFADTHIALGLATQNPSQFLMGAIPRAEKAFVQKMKNPNNIMAKSFKQVDEAVDMRKNLPNKMKPRSYVGKLAGIGSEYIDNGLKNILTSAKTQAEYTKAVNEFAEDIGDIMNIVPRQITHEATRFPAKIKPDDVIDWLVETAKTPEGREMIRRKLGADYTSLPPGSPPLPQLPGATKDFVLVDTPQASNQSLSDIASKLGTKNIASPTKGSVSESELQRLRKLEIAGEGNPLKEVPFSRMRK